MDNKFLSRANSLLAVEVTAENVDTVMKRVEKLAAEYRAERLKTYLKRLRNGQKYESSERESVRV